MIGLEEIYIYKNRLENICDSSSSIFDNMKHLKFLDIHSNYLTIFNIFTEMPILDSLLVSYNQISKINGLDQCSNLTNLDLNNNKITEFPPDILKLKKLSTLNLQNNDLNSIPNTLGLMNNLVRLNIEGNPLKRLVGKMRNCSTVELKNYLKSRITEQDLENTPMSKEDLYDINDENDNLNNQIMHNIYNNGLVMKEMNLKEIPVEEMQNCIQKNSLNKIDFSVNQIIDINNLTYVLNRIESITELNLSKNLIETFPLIILSLPNLSILNISKNKINRFPYDEFTSTNLSQIKCNLTSLDISFNFLTKFPDVIGLFQNISEINLANNNIISIDNILNMKLFELDILNLSDNKLEKLPNKLYKVIPKLKSLLCSNNDLRDVPSDVCLLKNLNNVNFYGNQIRRLRTDALTSATALLNYLRKIHIFDDEDKMNEANFNNNNNNLPQNQMNNFGNNNNFNNIRQKSGYKNMDMPSYHNTHGYDNQYQNQFKNKTNNYNNGNNMINQINNNYNQIGFNQQFQNKNSYQQNYSDNNNQINLNQGNNINKRTLDDINKDIANLEEEMSVPTLPQYQKAALRKKYHSLLVERSKFLK